jgi:hypothetical protein
VPRSSVLPNYTSHATAPASLAGMRIGIVRGSMLLRPGDKAAEPISRAAASEIKSVLGERLGATLVESGHRFWPADPDIEPMRVDFERRPPSFGASDFGPMFESDYARRSWSMLEMPRWFRPRPPASE